MVPVKNRLLFSVAERIGHSLLCNTGAVRTNLRTACLQHQWQASR